MVNRIWVPCEDQPNTNQRQGLEHYLHNYIYIKNNRLDYLFIYLFSFAN
jgi:hypothetical protein